MTTLATAPALPADTDVVVAGFGPAGAAAAIAAHDNGARVVLVEKTGAGGGNCVNSGGFLFELDGPQAIDHLDALCFGKTGRDVLAAFADGLRDVPAFLAELGGATVPVDIAWFGGMLPSWPHFPGAGRVRYRQYVAGVGQRPGVALWELLEAAVRERGIMVAFQTSVTELRTEGQRLCGVTVERDGSRQRINTTSVVLACGSFEADPGLCDTYLPLSLVSVGHQANTGDALRLAAQVDAQLWHMSAFFGWFSFVHPGYPAAFTLDVHAPSHLMLDGDGRRFADETGWEVHDRVRSATAFLPRRRNRPRMPGWLVFDEAARLAGPLHGLVGSPNGYAWSADNSAEVAAGWITQAANVTALAEQIGVAPATLEQTFAQYAAAVAAGRDDDFGRAPRTLVPLEPPLYAIRMHPGVATASGGPRRDAGARVLSQHGAAIRGLYAAGAAGSIWGHLTEHGGGLADALVFGRIAGLNASAER